ncbi:MAG: mechanosensitive ion channel [Sphingobacteriaceae bacterium]|nr:MAG: mechanosensitive ion channel [Sphingobacteriaceae bacterium]
MEFFGIDWVGINAENVRKLVISIAFILIVLALSALLRAIIGFLIRKTGDANIQKRFWIRQGISLIATVILFLGLLSIWFNDPGRLATALGLMSAGLAFALQQPVSAIAGYFVILRGSTFTIGDRISMGGVRGDVIRLGFIQTTIMEMGQPPAVQNADPAIWVKSRQFTGRIVTISNSKVFADPIFNYTREFPYIWEEMSIPITYQADRKRTEEIMLAAAKNHAIDVNTITIEAKKNMEERFGVEPIDLEPRVYYRITDNWLELTVRFMLGTHQIRGAKDAMSRQIMTGLDEAGIGIASATYDIVGFPPIQIKQTS